MQMSKPRPVVHCAQVPLAFIRPAMHTPPAARALRLPLGILQQPLGSKTASKTRSRSEKELPASVVMPRGADGVQVSPTSLPPLRTETGNRSSPRKCPSSVQGRARLRVQLVSGQRGRDAVRAGTGPRAATVRKAQRSAELVRCTIQPGPPPSTRAPAPVLQLSGLAPGGVGSGAFKRSFSYRSRRWPLAAAVPST